MLNFFKNIFGSNNKTGNDSMDMENHAVFDMPFSLLIDGLNKQGFTIGVDNFEQMHFVVQHAIKTEQTHRLHLFLCALLAQNDEQQHIFRETYKRVMLPQLEKTEAQIPQNKKHHDTSPAEQAQTEQQEHIQQSPAKQTPAEQERKKIVASLKACPANAQFVKAFPETIYPIAETKWIRLTRQLRYTHKTGRLMFDAHLTIKQTIKKAGKAMPQFSATRKHAEYLFLIDKYNDRDHLAQWHNQLYNLLVQNNINVTRFYFDHSPQICRNEKYAQGITIREILNRHEHAILFLFADGMQFIDTYTKTLYPWTSIFANWQLRIFFSTVAPTLWGKREKIISRLFSLVVPFNANGLSAVNQYLAGNANAESFAIPYWTQNPEINQTTIDTGDLMPEELDIYYNSPLKRWIAACAIYPELNWNLTIALGNELSTTQQPLHTAQNIKQLVRLDWFVKGRIPDKWRLHLINNYLTKPDIAQINRFLYKQLDANKPLPGAHGYNNYMLQLAIHDLLAETNRQKAQQKTKKLNQQLEKTGRLRDMVNLHIIKQEDYSPIYFELTEKQLQKLGVDLVLQDQTQATSFTNYTETATGQPFDMVAIKGGTFRIGGGDNPEYDDEKSPNFDITLKDFYMGKTEVTIGQYLIFCKEENKHWPEWLEKGSSYYIYGNGSDKDYYKSIGMSEENINHPITGVSWNDAKAYIAWLSKKTGKTYRLPSEAEWEYAASAPKNLQGFGNLEGLKQKWAGTNNESELEKYAWYDKNRGSKTHEVATLKPNPLGLYDMSGNVWEWCEDDWHDNYADGIAKDGIAWTDNPRGSYRILRGGSWDGHANSCRVANRNYGIPYGRGSSYGFRVVSVP